MTLPVLTTRRLILRPLERTDVNAIEEIGSKDFEIVRWLTGASWPYVEGEVEDYVDKVIAANPLEREAVYAVTLGGVFIGVAAIQAPGDLEDLPDLPSLGYWIGRPFQGHGYAKEAVCSVLAWGFDAFQTDTIVARAFEENSRSRGLLRKLGFKPTGMTVRFSKSLDRKVSNIVVKLDRADFEKFREAA